MHNELILFFLVHTYNFRQCWPSEQILFELYPEESDPHRKSRFYMGIYQGTETLGRKELQP